MRIFHELKSSQTVKCYVDPNNPQNSVIDLRISWFWIIMPVITCISFLLIGGLLIFISLPFKSKN